MDKRGLARAHLAMKRKYLWFGKLPQQCCSCALQGIGRKLPPVHICYEICANVSKLPAAAASGFVCNQVYLLFLV